MRFGIHLIQQNITLAECRDLWRWADTAGFDWFDVSDHFYESPMTEKRGPYLECLTCLAALACDTQHMRIGTVVLVDCRPAVLAMDRPAIAIRPCWPTHWPRCSTPTSTPPRRALRAQALQSFFAEVFGATRRRLPQWGAEGCGAITGTPRRPAPPHRAARALRRSPRRPHQHRPPPPDRRRRPPGLGDPSDSGVRCVTIVRSRPRRPASARSSCAFGESASGPWSAYSSHWSPSAVGEQILKRVARLGAQDDPEFALEIEEPCLGIERHVETKWRLGMYSPVSNTIDRTTIGLTSIAAALTTHLVRPTGMVGAAHQLDRS